MTRLVCPRCKSGDSLWSDEVASIMYPVRLTRESVDAAVEVEYTGESYSVMDEGTVYSGDIWCRDCGSQIGEEDLVPEEEEEEESDG